MAMITAFVLLIVFGVLQLATVTFYQLAADGATFVGSHDTVAQMQSPTTANLSLVRSNIAAVFKQITGSSVAVAAGSATFETDVSQSVPGISMPLSKSNISVTSRGVESDSGSANPTPISNCVSSSLNIGSNPPAQAAASSPLVKLLSGGDMLTTVIDPTTGQAAIGLSATNLTARLQLVTTIGTQLQTVVVSLKTIQTAVAPVQALLPSLTAPLGTTLSSLLGQALGGTYNATTAVTQVTQASSGLNLGSVLTTVIIPVVQSGGPLDSLNTSIKQLSNIDAGAVQCS
jgi:hypothetical protein